MSVSVTLFCVETKQAVHVAEASSNWFRGPDYPTVVGAFCFAHAGKELKTTLAFGELDDSMDYELWTQENVQDAYVALVGRSPDGLPERIVLTNYIDQGGQAG
jgi:hypothetical protein